MFLSNRTNRWTCARSIISVVLACGVFTAGCSGSAEDTLVDILALPGDEDPEETLVVVQEPAPQPQQDPIITSPGPTGLISGVSSGDEIGAYVLGSPPVGTGSLVLDPINDGSEVAIIPGGSTELTVRADQPFSTVYVLSDGIGYFQLLLPASVQSTSVVVSFSAEELAAGEQRIDVLAGGADGSISGVQTLPLRTIEVSTGDLQVSVSWDTETDVDLWLTEPDGNRIYFANRNSPSGGSLDLDSNAICFIDGINNENITYDGVIPSPGEYIVTVDYFSSCSITRPTNFVVTLRANGQTQTFRGQLVNREEIEVTRFVVR